jgi:hypothetical protein
MFRYGDAYQAARLLLLLVYTLTSDDAALERSGRESEAGASAAGPSARLAAEIRALRAAALALSVGLLPGSKASSADVATELARLDRQVETARSIDVVSTEEAAELRSQLERVRNAMA